MNKETGKEKAAEKERDQESISLSLTPPRAYTREELQKIANAVPTLGQVETFARDYLGFTDTDFIRDWYREMQMSFWCDEFGNPIRNWGWVFNKWRKNERLFRRLRDPDRVPDARKGGKAASRKADNWRGTSREAMDTVLG